MNSKGKEVPHGVRLYSIASSRYGDSFDGLTTSLCVRRATYTDPETGKEDPAKASTGVHEQLCEADSLHNLHASQSLLSSHSNFAACSSSWLADVFAC